MYYTTDILDYGDELVDAKSETFDKAYLEALDIYIGSEVLLAGKYDIPVLYIANKRKRDANNLPIGDASSNPIPDTCVCEL